jgi:hypothetical protein
VRFIVDKTVKHGAILFRGFPVESPSDFNDFANAFGWDNFESVGGASVCKRLYKPEDLFLQFLHCAS